MILSFLTELDAYSPWASHSCPKIFSTRTVLPTTKPRFSTTSRSLIRKNMLKLDNPGTSTLGIVHLEMKILICFVCRLTTTYALSLLAYNLAVGSSFSHVLIWHWNELKVCFGKMYQHLKFLITSSVESIFWLQVFDEFR